MSAMSIKLTYRTSPVKPSGSSKNFDNKRLGHGPKRTATRQGSESWRASLRRDRSRPPHNVVGVCKTTMPQLLRDAQNPKALRPDGRLRFLR